MRTKALTSTTKIAPSDVTLLSIAAITGYLRPYQKRDFRDVLAKCKHTRRVLYVAFMGSGKTVLAAALIRVWVALGERILIVVHTREILRQTDEKLRDLEGARLSKEQIGWIWREGIDDDGENRIRPEAPIQLASLDTLTRRDYPKNITRIVIDEAHHATAKKWRKVIDAYPKARVLGLTGTPTRLDGEPLGDVFDDMVESETVENLIAGGWISRPEYWTPEWFATIPRRSGRDFTSTEAGEMMRGTPILKGVVAEFKKHGCRPAIGFAATTEKATQYAKTFSRAGIPADTLFGTDTDFARRGKLAALRRGRLHVLWTCDVLSEGWDYKGLRCVMLARPTLSLSRYLQHVARCMRPGRGSPVILDLWGAYKVFGPPWAERNWSLHERIHKGMFTAVRKTNGEVEWAPPIYVNGKLVRSDDDVARIACKICGGQPTASSAYNALKQHQRTGRPPVAYCESHKQRRPVRLLGCAQTGCKQKATKRSSAAVHHGRTKNAYCLEHSGGPNALKPLLSCEVCAKPATRKSSEHARLRGGVAFCAKHKFGMLSGVKIAGTNVRQPLLSCAECRRPATRGSSRNVRLGRQKKAYCAKHRCRPGGKAS
jgi:superfamily II DNA or RNA helicase